MNNVTNKSAQDTQAQRNIADLQKRMAFLENLLIPAKETLTLEEAAVFLGMKRSTLYKMTHELENPGGGDHVTRERLTPWPFLGLTIDN